MPTLPVTQSAGSISRFLKHIQSAGVPPKVNNPYLKSVGFKSSNDAALIGILKAIGFIDGAGSPTDRWKDYRDATKARVVLADGVRTCYAGLFQIFPDADRKDDEAISNWIRSNSEFSGLTVERAVRTFKALCMEADFTTPAIESTVSVDSQQAGPPQNTSAMPVFSNTSGPSVNVNIELQLPSTNNPEVYDNFFKSMKKHLFDESR